jgi:hypothetical protein
MLFQVLLIHKKRLISVYRAIAEDHGSITLSRIDRKPSKAQKALRQGANLTQDEDTAMASSTNEPTAQEEAARKE